MVIPVGPKPHHMMASMRGDRVYVAEFRSNTVGVIDTAADTKVATFAASPDAAARTHAVWPSPDGRRIYATNEVTNDIAAIDATTGQLLWDLPVGEYPSRYSIIMPDGPRHCSQRGQGEGSRPHRAAFDGTGGERRAPTGHNAADP